MIELPDKKEGDEISASEWNLLKNAVRRLVRLQVAAPLQLHDSAGGIGISLAQTTDPDACVVRIDATCTGGGKYSGVLMAPPSTLACASGNLAMPEGMTAGDPCIIANLAEDGAATHNLATGKYHPGVITGQDSTGKWLVDIEVGSGTCAPGTDTFTAVTDSNYDGTSFVNTVTTYDVDFCAGTITVGSTANDTVFSTDACDDLTTISEFYAY